VRALHRASKRARIGLFGFPGPGTRWLLAATRRSVRPWVSVIADTAGLGSAFGMAAAVGAKVLPGERVGLAEALVAGRGTYVNGLHVCASIVGVVELAKAQAADVDMVRRLVAHPEPYSVRPLGGTQHRKVVCEGCVRRLGYKWLALRGFRGRIATLPPRRG
jgi:hypothetical protein